ncbi:hypothetical protein E8E11_004909 [Didymella keratinophila]|nr:hypothetical protein E8E11_004909 [Didymella keratinophila]
MSLTAGEAYNRQRSLDEDVPTLAKYLAIIDLRRDIVRPEETESSLRFDREHMDRMHAVSRVVYCIRRRFFVTATGRIGLGPRVMQPDDLVTVLWGGDTPFILRRADTSLLLLGPAYVHGVMDEEAVRAWMDSDDPVETVFVIR